MTTGKILKRSWIPFIVLCVVASYAYPFIHFKWLTRKWEAQIKRDQDPVKLQAWAVRLMDTYGITNIEDISIITNAPPTAIPKSSLGPNVALRNLAIWNGGHFVQLTWGSGVLGLWGLEIGDSNYVSGSEMWKPGIYFFRSP